jgi:hypothetical protein
MESMEQVKKSIGDAASINEFKSQGIPGLTFGKMLERFYLNQTPPDLPNPEVLPPVNLKDRKQG